MGILCLVGPSDLTSVVVRSSLVQLETPDEMRGRVSAVNSIFICASNQLGEFESGVTEAWLGTGAALGIGGFGTLLVVFLWIRLFPGLFSRDTLPNELPPTIPTMGDIASEQSAVL